ncbi:MAG: TerD family protein [Flavobacteriales bacterium]|nr:TerD family protein [Flavobacteriales bacterium]
MAINLEKGQRISLGLSNVTLGLGWDPNQSTGNDFDLDASAFCLGDNGKIPQDEYFIFYNNKFSPDGAVEGADDDQTGGASDGDDDEQVKVNLSKLDPKIKEIVFVVTIHEATQRSQNFGQVRNSYIRIVDESSNSEIAKYELEEDFSVETSVEFGRLYKKDNEWKFQAMGDGFKEGLNFFVNKYTN